jgi:hypothetical protein
MQIRIQIRRLTSVQRQVFTTVNRRRRKATHFPSA